jgi:beta-phosphoglucomutase family hydrolase
MASPSPGAALGGLDAVLFDLDGVLTPTASIHRAAWKQMFDHALRSFADDPTEAAEFSEQDYLDYVDGKPRQDGVRDFLASRGIVLPLGQPSDPPGTDTVWALGNRKNALFGEVLDRDGIAAFPGSLRLVDHLGAEGVPMAVVSSSRNARHVLAAAGLTDRFDHIVDGVAAAERGLPGKPAPDAYLLAASELGVQPERAAVLEDALSGVAAGRNGGFGVVIGVDRGAGEEAMLEAGADVVVTDLAELLPPRAVDVEVSS